MTTTTYIFNFILLLFYLGVPIIIVPTIYYKIENKFLDRELKKLYNINFSFNYKDPKNFLIDQGLLIFGYMVSGSFVLYALCELYKFRSPSNINITDQSFIPIACASMAICFAARYTCRKKGYEKGKQILLLIVSADTIVFMINLFRETTTQLFTSMSEPTTFTNVTLLYFKYFLSTLLTHSINIAVDISKTLHILFIGSFVAAFVGELILIKESNCSAFVCNHQNLYGYVPPFSDFEFIPYYKLTDKMREMTKSNKIKSVKIISHTLGIFEIVYHNLFCEISTNPLIIIGKPNLAVELIAPRLDEIEYFGTFFSYLFNKKGLAQYEQLKKERYRENFKKIEQLYKNEQLKWVDYNFKSFRILIVDANKCLLITDSLSPSGRKIGLYTEDPNMIINYIRIFDSRF